jgi:hypothetical protein
LNNIKVITKNKLYYGKYKYRAYLHYPDICLIRYTKTEKELDKAIGLRKTYSFGRMMYEDSINKEFLLKLINWRNNTPKERATVRIDYDCISVYSNDLEIVKSLESLSPSSVHYSEIKVEGDVGILLRNSPKHKFRTYFRSKTVPDGFHMELENFLQQYSKSAHPTGSLKKWLKTSGPATWRLRYLDACFFIDYDSEAFLSVLALNFSEYLGKTYKVEQR